MVEFKTGMTKAELLEIATENGIPADDSMTKAAIIDALNAYNAQTPAGQPTAPAGSAADGGGGNDTTGGENGAESATEGGEDPAGSGADGGGGTTAEEATEGAGRGEEGGEDNSTTPGEKPAEQPAEDAEGYDTFVYVGPSIPRGRLKENAVFRGTLADVLNYLADVIEDYPQIPRLIVPTNRLAAFSVKVKTPGNIAHKYYTDIVSAMKMKKNKEG